MLAVASTRSAVHPQSTASGSGESGFSGQVRELVLLDLEGSRVRGTERAEVE